MQLTTNQMHFFISYAVALLAFGLIGKWYVWPNIKDRALKAALRVPAGQRSDVPNAGARLTGASERFRRPNRLW
jgi:hypothetical protein